MNKPDEIRQAVESLNAGTDASIAIEMGLLNERIAVGLTRGKLILKNGQCNAGLEWIGKPKNTGTLTLQAVDVYGGDVAFRCVDAGHVVASVCILGKARQGLAVERAWGGVRLSDCAADDCSGDGPDFCGVFLGGVRGLIDLVRQELYRCGGPHDRSHALYIDARCGKVKWKGGSVAGVPKCPIPVTIRAQAQVEVSDVSVDVGECHSVFEAGSPDGFNVKRGHPTRAAFANITGRAEAQQLVGSRGHSRAWVAKSCRVGGVGRRAAVTGEPFNQDGSPNPGWGAGAGVRCE